MSSELEYMDIRALENGILSLEEKLASYSNRNVIKKNGSDAPETEDKVLGSAEKGESEKDASVEKADVHISEQIKKDMGIQLDKMKDELKGLKELYFNKLDPWQIALVARNIKRPSTLEFVKYLCGDEFVEMHGDRLYGDDHAIVGGIGTISGHSVMIIGHQKGHDTESNIYRNFGMAHPEGYRKALRLMKTAERFGLPVITFIDTPGAYPGIGAEERGQSVAIAENLAEMSTLRVPIMCFITGEGGSGGALALGVGDRIFMFMYSIYSVISAEGCAAILWNDPAKTKEAAAALKFRAQDLLDAGVIDEILPEPVEGAHKNHQLAAQAIKEAIEKHLPILMKTNADELIKKRYERFRNMGCFVDEEGL